ncbi:MAG TPA: hypothetical protein V6D07_17140 [Trichocoleus sp.]
MNSYTHYPNQSSLDRDSSLESSSSLLTAVKRAGQAFVEFLTSGNDLRIWTRQRNGHLIWHVYDPMTEQRQQFSSEEELRSWLENRYYA